MSVIHQASVVIAAYNEEAVLGRCLTALSRGVEPGEFDVVVVANGCTDDTAAVARAAGARVIETPMANKSAALALGDRSCRTFPRLYLDADVELAGRDVRTLVSRLTDSAALACAPAPHFDMTGAGPVISRAYRTYDRLMVGRLELAGAGAYMLSEQGHPRIFPLPDVVSDDGWVHRSFAPAERLIVTDVTCVQRPPRTVLAEARRRVRSRRANRELTDLGLPSPENPMRPTDLAAIVGRAEVGVTDGLCFLWLLVLDRVLDRMRVLTARSRGWETDTTSRQPEKAGGT